MSVMHQMLGRELPCSVIEMLGVRPMPLPGAVHEALADQLSAGIKYPDVLYKLGLSHLGRQELGLARTRFEEAIALKSEYWPARVALAGVCDLLAQHAAAVDQIDAILAIEDPKIPRYTLLCAAGFCLERLGTSGTAAFRYEQALAHEPTDLFAHHRLAAIYLAHNQLNEAVTHHEAILEAEPQEQAVRTSLAHVLQLLGRHQEAVWQYEKALCLQPESWELQLEMVNQFERMGDEDKAITQLRGLLDQHPEFPDLHLRLANLHSTRGDDAAASAEYGEALSLHPQYLDGHIALARHELRMGRVEPASEHFHKALGINDQNVEAYAGLAVALHRQGKPEQAKEILANAWKIAGNSDVLLGRLGLLELEAEAAQSVEAAFDPDQQAPATNEREVQRLWIDGQIKRYETILEEHPVWTDVRLRYGMLLKLVGRLDEAETQFMRIVSENPGYADGWVQLGLVRQQRGDQPGAIDALETAIGIKPEYADLHYRLGLIYCNALEFDLAMERLEEAATLNNQNPDFQRHLWVALQGMQMTGRRAKAELFEERVAPLHADSIDE